MITTFAATFAATASVFLGPVTVDVEAATTSATVPVSAGQSGGIGGW